MPVNNLKNASNCLVQTCISYGRIINQQGVHMGWSPGLVIKWEDLCSEGCEFESQHLILEGYFSHLFVVRIV